jgi:hypothetical protein
MKDPVKAAKRGTRRAKIRVPQRVVIDLTMTKKQFRQKSSVLQQAVSSLLKNN